MKKVLILAYDFPPYVSVGALRPHNWFKYFNEFGIYPIVVTRQWNNLQGTSIDYVSESKSNKVIIEETEFGKIIQAPFKPHLGNKLLLRFGENKFVLLRRLITAFFELMQFISPIGPKYSLFKTADQFLKTNKVDLIIATGDPFILFKYASDLSKKHKTKWVADYRDPWSYNLTWKKPMLKFFYRTLEFNIVNSSNEVITVSELLAAQINDLIKRKSPKLIQNGFDPEALASAKDIKQNDDILTISLAGTIYEWHPIISFLSVLNDLVHQYNLKLRINFYGINNEIIISDALNSDFFHLQGSVNIYPKMKNSDIMMELAKSNLLLLFNYYSYMGTKIYEYIGLKRKILFCYSDEPKARELKDKFYVAHNFPNLSQSLQLELIKSTDSGIIVKDEEHLKKVLLELNQEFLTHREISVNPKNYEIFSRKNQTEKLAEILKNVMG